MYIFGSYAHVFKVSNVFLCLFVSADSIVSRKESVNLFALTDINLDVKQVCNIGYIRTIFNAKSFISLSGII